MFGIFSFMHYVCVVKKFHICHMSFSKELRMFWSVLQVNKQLLIGRLK